MINEVYAIHIALLEAELGRGAPDVQSELQGLITQLGDEALQAKPFIEPPMVYNPEEDSMQDRGVSISGKPYKAREKDTRSEVL